MLKRLEIQNYAIIDHLEIDFSNGLSIITGETGAGKSILLGALGLIMGKRADTKVLFDQEKKCFVEASFSLNNENLKPFFEEEGLDYESELIIRREIAVNGKSRAFVNDSPCTLDVIQTLSDSLVDLHQQFDMLDIFKESFQIQILDALASNQPILDQYQSLFKKYKEVDKKIIQLQKTSLSANQEIDFLTFQMDEFDKANLVLGEKEEKEQELELLTNAQEIIGVFGDIYRKIDDDEISVNTTLKSVLQRLEGIKEISKDFESLYDRLSSILEELVDISRESGRIAESTEHDPESIQILQERLNLIYRLEKKHGVHSVEELLKLQDDIQNKLAQFSDLTGEIERLETQKAEIQKELNGLAQQLTKNRVHKKSDFESQVHVLLETLKMEHAKIKVEIKPLQEFTILGLDSVNFLFAPNKGSEFLPLKNVASGGEISRLNLCIKSLVADAITLPTLIFDEIDTGVSGDVAMRMGELFIQLAGKHQVISITHSPQIASKAHQHYFVYKDHREDRTYTGLKWLNDDEKIIEIAKMLSGDPPSSTALAAAKEMRAN